MSKEKVLFSWSGGKDSALALYEILQSGRYEIAALLTTVTEEYDRISMHGVRRSLLLQQAKTLDLPLEEVFIANRCTNQEYEEKMSAVLQKHLKMGVESVVFGDLFLEDIRKYREENLARLGMKGIFPLWGRDSGELAERFIELGFKAVLTCVDSEVLDGSFAGRLFDRRLLDDLPEGVDPCGENGEFHTFVFDGPIFNERIVWRPGALVLREQRFYFFDVIPVWANSLNCTKSLESRMGNSKD